MPEPIAHNYREALEAMISDYHFLGTSYSDQVLSVAMAQLSQPEETPALVLFWSGVGQYIHKRSTPYYFGGDVCQLIAAGANALDNDYKLQREDIPGPTGFFHYKHAFLTEQTTFEDTGLTYTVRLVGVSWATYNKDMLNFRPNHIRDNVGMNPDKADGILIMTWSTTDELTHGPAYRSDGLPLSMHKWDFGMSAAEVYEEQDSNSDKLAAIREKIGHNPDYTECTVIAASMLFLQQTIIQVIEGEIPRRQEKQLLRSNSANEMFLKNKPKIVALRRRKTVHSNENGDDESADMTEHQKREWTHRWVVSGFWRNQHYGVGRALIKRIWINDFIKGPDDKPLRAKAIKIAAVVR